MSDPVKSAEVEDVLSSIRRLVSEDKRPAVAPKAVDVAQDRLVLTPALRVMEENVSAEEETDASQEARTGASIDEPWQDTLNEDAQAGEAMADDAPLQLGEPVAIDLHTDERLDDEADHTSADEVQTFADADHTSAGEGHTYADADHISTDEGHTSAEADHISADEDHTLAEADQELAEDDYASAEDGPVADDCYSPAADDEIEQGRVADETISEDEDAGDIASDDAGPAETADEDTDRTVFASFDDQAEEAEAFFEVKDMPAEDPKAEGTATETTAVSDPVVPEVPAAETTRAAASLSSKIAALEAVIGGREDQWEPDDTGGSDYSGTEAPAMAWDDPEPDPVIEAAVAPERTDLADAEDLLDEETLREMVSDIVREELQGALGERITRNVRKLVRREIHRALTAQDLE